MASTAFAADGAVWDPIKIVGGTTVKASDPIASTTVGLSDGYSLCTASIIDKDMIVTAAHCVDGVDISQLQVLFGTKVLSGHVKAGQAVGALQNPGWQGDASTGADEHDIAVVRFSGGLPHGYAAARIFTDTASLQRGDSVVLAGYGITNAETQAGAGTLRKTTVSILDPEFGQTEIEFDQSAGHGACHGDSGGPAFIQKDGQLYLLALTNRGYPDDAPDDCMHDSIYTKIAAYADWIKQAEQTLRHQR